MGTHPLAGLELALAVRELGELLTEHRLVIGEGEPGYGGEPFLLTARNITTPHDHRRAHFNVHGESLAACIVGLRNAIRRHYAGAFESRGLTEGGEARAYTE